MHVEDAVLTRAVSSKACSPGRIGLVLIQLICRCVQHHQEKKSASQRHRPFNTDDRSKRKDVSLAFRVIHKEYYRSEELEESRNRTNLVKAANSLFTSDSSLSLGLA